jgi:purine-nucleoside phosphorylase
MDVWQSRVRKGGDEVTILAAGPGFLLARRAIEAYSGTPDAVVSAGLAGALDPSLEVGDIVLGTKVSGRTCELAVSRLPHRCVEVLSQDRVAGTAEEKARLRSTGAGVVEMEALEVVRYAEAINTPAYCIKSISDTAAESFALDLNKARDKFGRFRASSVVWQAIQQPGKGIPELRRLKRNGEVAAKSLGAFFADCTFG